MDRSAVIALALLSATALAGCVGRPAGRPGVPIEPERVPMAMACAKQVLERAGGFIGGRDEKATRIDARIVREASPDEREVDLLAFEISRSGDGSMLLARSFASSRVEHGNPADAGRHYFVERPTPRASAQALSDRLLTCAM